MSTLDMRTIVVIYVIVNVIVTAVMAAAWRKNRERYPGLAWWLADYALQFLGLFFISARGFIPEAVSIMLGGPLCVAGFLALLRGLSQYGGAPLSLIPGAVFLVVFVGAEAYFTLAHPSLGCRNILLSLALCIVGIRTLWLLRRHPDGVFRKETILVSGVFWGYFLVSCGRILVNLSRESNEDFFSSGLSEGFFVICYLSLQIALTFALLLSIGQRLFRDIEADVAERKRAEERIRESEEKFLKAFMSSPYAIAITRPSDGMFMEVNEAFEKITGYSRDEATADSSIGLHLWIKAEDRFTVIEDLRAGKPVAGKEINLRAKNGAILTGLFSARFLRLGKELCVISSINDITDRKRAEAEKTKLEEQLRQSEKLEAIGQLAGGVAHDFNNLLGSIMGLAEVMRMRPGTSGENLQCIEKIVRIINQASNLIGQLLTFARKTEFDRTVVNVHQSIRNVMDLLRHSVDKRIAITGSLGASSAVILGDACQIENALLNIGINARDAMPRGGTLSFSTETVRMRSGEPPCDKLMLAPGKYVKISMSDTGTGMTPDVRERIFEPFFTTKEPGKGTGLGLSSVYGCMKRHGGAIAVESSPGEGTTFSLYLPAGLAVNGAGPPPEEVLVRGSGFVLIVDDEATICEILTEIVASLGYGSFLCSDPMEAMTYFRDHHTEIDAVLLDLVMPGMSGSECFEKMKEIDPAVAVVIVSGCGDERELKKLKDGGVSTIVSKPFTAGKISKSLYEAIASPG